MVYFTQDYLGYAQKMAEGLVEAFPESYEQLAIDGGTSAVIAYKHRTADHTAIVLFGGGGNGPMLHGSVSGGMADASVLGLAYASANAYAIYETGKMLGRQKGVFFLYNQFMGDHLNYLVASSLMEKEKIRHKGYAVSDDIATALGENRNRRNGRLGLAYLTRIASGWAQRGMTPDGIRQKVEAAGTRLGTISCKIDILNNKVVYGGGFSGEPGILECEFTDAKSIAEQALSMLLEDLAPTAGEKLYCMINRLRYVSHSDSYIMEAEWCRAIRKTGLEVARTTLANYSNIMDAYGYDFCILCADKETQTLLDKPLYTPFFMV